MGVLLAAHAARLQDAAAVTIAAFEDVGESPLGSGAVAGSTLPLDPAYTAGLLGLRPPRSALLATGSRDAVVRSCQAAANAGIAISGLAQDLLDLFASGAIKLPAGYTTGSSLMPQKRNPDALELARGRAKALAGPLAAVTSIVSGLGLGYQRDFQLTKPWLVQALGDAAATAELLAPPVAGMTIEPRANAAEWAKPGILATDVAEALVAAGLPFRTAYGVTATMFAKVEAGSSLADAIAGAELSEAQRAAALAVTLPDPSRRATIGGPAPAAVAQTLVGIAARSTALGAQVAAAQKAAERPLDLLTVPIASLMETLQ
jgi:argininosuccinate lyase